MSHALLENTHTEQVDTTATALPYLTQTLTLAAVAVVLLVMTAVFASPLAAVGAVLALGASVVTFVFGQFHQVLTV